jgi:hypothetical protein
MEEEVGKHKAYRAMRMTAKNNSPRRT